VLLKLLVGEAQLVSFEADGAHLLVLTQAELLAQHERAIGGAGAGGGFKLNESGLAIGGQFFFLKACTFLSVSEVRERNYAQCERCYRSVLVGHIRNE
jgi:hypothetical protein